MERRTRLEERLGTSMAAAADAIAFAPLLTGVAARTDRTRRCRLAEVRPADCRAGEEERLSVERLRSCCSGLDGSDAPIGHKGSDAITLIAESFRHRSPRRMNDASVADAVEATVADGRADDMILSPAVVP
jgi:hypothetical protein